LPEKVRLGGSTIRVPPPFFFGKAGIFALHREYGE